MFWDTVYFDQSDASQFAFTGAASTAYRGFNFSNCYFRDSPRGIVFSHTGTLAEVRITGCTFYTHEESAVIVGTGSAVDDIHIVGTTFRDNNTNNSASQGDVILIGNRNNVIGCKFLTGGANGNAVKFATGSIDCLISDCDLVGSSATVKIANSGSQTKFGTLTGVNYKKTGSATIPSGGTSVTVTHGMSATPNLEQILVTPRTSFSSGTSFWVSNLTATTFDINCATTSTGIVFTWLVDMTG